MKSFQTPYERSTTATCRKAPRFCHVSLWYEKIGENESKFKKDASPQGQVTRTKTKWLTSDEMHIKLMKRKWFRELFSAQIESRSYFEKLKEAVEEIDSIVHPKELPSDNT